MTRDTPPSTMIGGVLVALAVAGVGVGAIDVIRQQVSFEEDYSVTVDNTVEYILEFIPSGEQAQWPVLVRMRASGGDTSRPVLLTARQTAGAQTWQLPYRAADAPAGDMLFEMQRTLCYDPEQSGSSVSGQFSLHMSTSGTPVSVTARADPARDWMLSSLSDVQANISLTAPRALYYRFAAGEERVRLVVASEDDVCAVVGVHNYTCPVAELANTITSAGFHKTVQRSGGMQLSRSQFPSGFFVVALVKASDRDCNGEEEADADWLWDAALGVSDVTTTTTAGPRAQGERGKTLIFTIKAALSRTQYAVAVAGTSLVFLLFYAAFGALVWAQRFDLVRRHVGPKAATATAPADHTEGGENMVEGAARRRRGRRRDSDATFDSVDDDSESEDEDEPAPSPYPYRTPHAPHAPTAAAVNVAYSAERVDEGDVTANCDVTRTNVSTNRVRAGNEVGTYIVGGARNGNDVVAGTDVGGGLYAPVAEGGAGGAQGAGRGQRAGEPAHVPTEGRAAPFGLPARLRVAALARRRERTLRARSDRYLHTLYTVALFYTLPVVQFVAAFQIMLNVSGSLDLCYYNFLCAHPLGAVSDFNHVFSNAGYLLLGALFLLQVRRRRARRRRAPLLQGYGLPAHYGLLSSLGAGMMVVALLSASYHICPNALNFQFDTAFMYVLAALAMVKLYQARHPDINARAHHTFAVLALLIALVVWGVLGGGALFWGVCTALHVFAFLLLSLRIYYVGQFTLDGAGLAEAARGLARPLYLPRLVMLLIANALNWAFALYGLITMPADFATHLLMVMLMNTLVYMVFYIVMKLVCGERLRWYAWLFLGAAAAAWAPALYYFLSGSTSWAATPAHSRHLNHECRVLHFYDNHDLWHMLSALALYLSFNAMLTWDDGLSAVKRSQIAVF